MESQNKENKKDLKEILRHFRENVLITPFKNKKKENKELNQIFNMFQMEIGKTPKLDLKAEIQEIKAALQDLLEIERDWLRYI